MTPENFLFLEPCLKDALRARLPPHVYVLSAADLEGVSAETQPAPAVHVLYHGFRVVQSGGSTLEVVQRWLTVVVERNLRDTLGGADARADAGPLATMVLDALLGREFDSGGALRPIDPPLPGFRNGHLYLPLGWEAPITFWRQQCLD